MRYTHRSRGELRFGVVVVRIHMDREPHPEDVIVYDMGEGTVFERRRGDFDRLYDIAGV